MCFPRLSSTGSALTIGATINGIAGSLLLLLLLGFARDGGREGWMDGRRWWGGCEGVDEGLGCV